MELIQQYLEEVQKIDGIWFFQYPKEMTQEEMTEFHNEWRRVYPDEIIVMLPNDISVHKRNRYSFYIAMMLIRMGHRITRHSWTYDHQSLAMVPYLSMGEADGLIEPILIKKYPGKSEDDEFFMITQRDLDADDYMLAPKGE